MNTSPRHLIAALLFSALTLGVIPNISQAESTHYATLPDSIDEASGLTPSLRHPGLFWTHDDNVNLPHSPKGGTPWLFAIDADGKSHARLLVDGVKRRDWEAITRMIWQGKPTLVVGDIGDNRESWPDYRLWLVPEPDVAPQGKSTELKEMPVGLLRFRYPDGSHDAESLAVDAANQQILILTKRQRPARLYAVPLKDIRPIDADPKTPASRTIRQAERAARKHLTVAQLVATLPDLNPTDPIGWLLSPLIGHRAYRPTDMALSNNTHLLAVLTYASVYLFAHRPGQSWADSMKQPIDSISLPFIDQWEGISFSPDQRSLVIVREGEGPRTLLRLALPERLQPH